MGKKLRLDLVMWDLARYSMSIEGFSYALNFLGDFIVLHGMDETDVRDIMRLANMTVKDKTTVRFDMDNWFSDEKLDNKEMISRVRGAFSAYLAKFRERVDVIDVRLGDTVVFMHEVMGSLLIASQHDDVIGVVSFVDVQFGVGSLLSLSDILDDNQFDDLILVVDAFYKEKAESKATVSGLSKN